MCNDTTTTKIYTLSLHDALPISLRAVTDRAGDRRWWRGKLLAAAFGVEGRRSRPAAADEGPLVRSEEHTSELQSRLHLVCRLLLEKKKMKTVTYRLSSYCHTLMI